MQEPTQPRQKTDKSTFVAPGDEPDFPHSSSTQLWPLAGSHQWAEEVLAELPEPLKTQIEALSSLSMNDVIVHYNSALPAQVQALAYTQGSQIYLGPGQEQHLAHEAWHVVQQKQGRVKPTLQARGMAINDDQELEQEANMMGWQASQGTILAQQAKENSRHVGNPLEPIDKRVLSSSTMPIQRYFTHEGKEIKSQDLDTIQVNVLKALANDDEGKDIANEFFVTRAERELPTSLFDWLRENDIPVEVVSPVLPLPPTGSSREYKKKESGEVKEKKDGEGEKPLNEIAQAIHMEAKGHASQNTTGVGRLKNGELVVATQISLEAVKKAANVSFGIEDKNVMQTLGDGVHAEVTLFIEYGADLVKVGASQGFCPACYTFLNAKKIGMDGPKRTTNEQKWKSPENYAGREKDPKDAPYPWLYTLIEPEKERRTFQTKEEYQQWYKQRTGEDLP
jgi:hypothetical protein